MSTFQVNNNDPPHVMYDKLMSHIANIKKEKYNVVLGLLNELFKKDNKNIKNFSQIDSEYFNTDRKNIDKYVAILESYKQKLGYDMTKIQSIAEKNKPIIKSEKRGSIVLPDPTQIKTSSIVIGPKIKSDMITNSNNTLVKSSSKSGSKDMDINKEIFDLLSKQLKVIGYKFIKTLKNDKVYYTVILEK